MQNNFNLHRPQIWINNTTVRQLIAASGLESNIELMIQQPIACKVWENFGEKKNI